MLILFYFLSYRESRETMIELTTCNFLQKWRVEIGITISEENRGRGIREKVCSSILYRILGR